MGEPVLNSSLIYMDIWGTVGHFLFTLYGYMGELVFNCYEISMGIWVNRSSSVVKSQQIYMYGEAVLNSYLISMSGWERTEVQVLRNLCEYMGEPVCNSHVISMSIWVNRGTIVLGYLQGMWRRTEGQLLS